MASSQAAIVLDHFDDPLLGQGASISNPVGATGPISSTDTGLAAIGGSRTIYVGTTAGDGRSRIAVGANISPDYFTIANDSVTIDGYGGVIWDANGSGLNADIADCKLIRWDYDNDQETTYSLTLWTFGGSSHTESVTIGASAFGAQSIWLAPFAVAGVDLTDVDWIQLEADSKPGGDVAIHLVECDIPEPATTGVAFAALAGLGMVIRRFRKA
jgi:hypothetical protein